ncbi:MAG: DUF4129 domain-containing protein [Gammaproteobacteria bacterium]|jgi:hypothetical protein|nr:DUF4129 domain-containing protein [Gammaproteobacteria bacterium]
MRLLSFAFFLLGCAVLSGGTVAAERSLAPETPAAHRLAEIFSPALLNQITQCLQRIQQRYRDDPDFEFNLQQHCQTLARRLANQDFSAYLQPPLDSNLSVEQLMDLQSIAATVNAGDGATLNFQFDAQALTQILDNTLVLEPEPDVSWWQQFLNWLAEIFERNEPKQPDWLKDWLSTLSVPQWFVEGFYKTMVILLAIFLLAIIVVEIRAAGVSNWFRRRSQRLNLRKSQPLDAQQAMLTWEAIAQLPSREKILTAYHKLLHTMANKNLIPKDSSLTNHEIQSRLETTLGGEQPVFRQLVRGVETTLYGDKALEPATLDNLIRSTAQFADTIAAHQPAR